MKVIEKKYIFRYDSTKPAWCGHTRYLEHSGQECIAIAIEDDTFSDMDVVHIKFEDGFAANVYAYELEEVDG